MAGSSVVKFILDGTGKAIQQVDSVKKSLLGLNQANASPSDKKSAREEREGRARFGKLAKVGQLASGIGPIGQLAEIAGAATPGIAALGIAAVAGGFALMQFGKMVNAGIDAIKADVQTRFATTATIKAATESANQTALGSAMSQRDKLLGGNPAAITPDILKFYQSIDKLQGDIDKANMARAMSTGEGVMRAELARTRSPESAALLDMSKTAEEAITIQREISAKLSPLQELVVFFTNGMQGKSMHSDLIDAQRHLASIGSAGAP